MRKPIDKANASEVAAPEPNDEVDNETDAADGDPFSQLESLRLDQSFADQVGVKKLLTTVPVRKPNRHDFVRVHPDPAYRLTPAALIELKDDRETFLVPPAMAIELPGEFVVATLYTAITRPGGVLHLWPIRLPGVDGKHNEWHRSAAEAAELAMDRWIRVKANMALRANEIEEAIGDLPDPTWPDLPFSEILRIAFRNHIIDSFDHPVVQRLRGAV